MKNTKRALLMSALSMLLCLTMLIGSTFAWFTDTVTAGKNKIVAGNLDVELEYWDAAAKDGAGDWLTVKEDTNLFKSADETLWEPGHTEYVKLRIRNAGTLALKYTFGLNIFGDEEGGKENTYTSVNFKKDSENEHETFKLSDYIVFNKIENVSSVDEDDRTTFWDDSLKQGNFKDIAIKGEDGNDAWLKAGEVKDFYLAAYMPTTVGNEANQLTGADGGKEPTVYLGITLNATQVPHESDSFGNTYDEKVEYPGTPEKPVELTSYVPEIGAGNYILANEITNDYSNPISVTKGEAVIDLNGNHVGAINILGGAALTVKDSVGGGKLDRICFDGGGTLLLESGEVKNIMAKGTDADKKATATINGGTISGNISAKYLALTINDVNFTCDDTDQKLVFKNNACTGTDATINGGTFAGYIQLGTQSYQANLTINGGTYNEDVLAGYGTVTITGGTFNKTVGLAVGSTAALSITGGNFKNDPSTYVEKSTHTVTVVDNYFVVTPNS